MPSPLNKSLVLKASDEGIVVEWWSAPRWNLLEVCISIGLTLLEWCVDGDNAISGHGCNHMEPSSSNSGRLV
jgi:hypothetical protein